MSMPFLHLREYVHANNNPACKCRDCWVNREYASHQVDQARTATRFQIDNFTRVFAWAMEQPNDQFRRDVAADAAEECGRLAMAASLRRGTVIARRMMTFAAKVRTALGEYGDSNDYGLVVCYLYPSWRDDGDRGPMEGPKAATDYYPLVDGIPQNALVDYEEQVNDLLERYQGVNCSQSCPDYNACGFSFCPSLLF